MTDQFLHLLTQISTAESKRSEALCSRLADNFENDLLEYEVLPDSHFDFFIALLTSEQYYSKPGIWNFLLAINNASDSLTKLQFENISLAFTDNFVNYTDKELCLAVCDFIARNFEQSKARELLKKLKELESHKNSELQGYVDEGFFILMQNANRAIKNAIN
jgi:hypothetical protein